MDDANDEELEGYYLGAFDCRRSAKIQPLTSLTAEERATYTPVIDDILTKHGKRVMSADHILKKLQERLDHDHDPIPCRYPVRLLIIERLRKQPIPETVAHADERGATGTAAIAVFNVSELLESILAHLCIKDLCVSGYVNKALYRLISTSTTLQRNLFLLPGKGLPQKWQPIQDHSNSHIHAVLAASGNDITTPLGTPCRFYIGRPTIVARLNPLLQMREFCSDYKFVADRLLFEDFSDCAILDERILEAHPHMYLTNPPCTCVHIDVSYAERRSVERYSLRVRRDVYNRGGVTFGDIYNALHRKGFVAIYNGSEYSGKLGFEQSLVPDTTVREQIQILEREGFRPTVTDERAWAVVQFCHLAIPSDAEFEEMRRNGCVEGSPIPTLEVDEYTGLD